MGAGQTRNIEAALRELARAETIQITAKKQKRYFRINPRFKLYDELHDLASDSRLSDDDEVSKIMKKLPRARLVVLSGIFAFAPHLSADMLIVGDGINRKTLGRMLSDVEKLAGQEINFAVMDPREYEYRRTMNDRFVRDILENNHIVVLDNLKK
ncbi:hypothetical protein D4R52_03575 [bacterium]|nr:MAG: hypothetical protein D4R52_03575 [bacterium]